MIMDENPLSGRLVVLTCTVETRDMSVGDKRSFTMNVDADTLTAGRESTPHGYQQALSP